jgi:hypothetical protein
MHGQAVRKSQTRGLRADVLLGDTVSFKRV